MASRVANRNNAAASAATTAANRAYANGTSGQYSRNRAPAPPPVRYTIESVRDKHGKEQEVLTLEDTPEPSAAATSSSLRANQAYTSTAQARTDPYGGYEPATKKRKSDASTTQAHGGYSNGYAGGSGAQTYRAYNAQVAPNGSGQKRKHDEYARDNDVRSCSSLRFPRAELLRVLTCIALHPGFSTGRKRERERETHLES